jgi:hypothetical protein
MTIRSSLSAATALTLTLVIVTGCSDSSAPVEITDAHQVTEPGLLHDGKTSTAEQFGFAGRTSAPAAPSAGSAECTLSVVGGGILANLNRWRGQLGLEPIDAAAMAELPRRDFLGGKAILLDITGEFSGMDGVSRGQSKLLGALLDRGGQDVYVKFVGPTATVTAAYPAFLAFCDSVSEKPGGDFTWTTPPGWEELAPTQFRIANLKVPGKPAGGTAGATTRATTPVSQDSGALPPGHPPMPGSSSAGETFDPAKLSWQLPEHWKRGRGHAMRLATFVSSNSSGIECVVTAMPGDAGGVDANINWWRAQVGAEELDAAGIAALPKVTVLGTETPLVEVDGDLEGMGGGTPMAKASLLGVVSQAGDHRIFIKMTGPSLEVADERDHFLALLESLHYGE